MESMEQRSYAGFYILIVLKMEVGKKSIAVAFHLQHAERTLTDEEVDALIQTVTEMLQEHTGATIRA